MFLMFLVQCDYSGSEFVNHDLLAGQFDYLRECAMWPGIIGTTQR
jgi:hypothetical protein